MTMLVLGAGGQIGRALAERAGTNAVGVDRATCDIRDSAAVERAIDAARPAIIVNCAGYSAVDRAEGEREEAFSINADGARIVARCAFARRLPVIHLSSDYVYAGTRTGPHREDDAIAPLNVYGASKAAGDAAVTATNPHHLILRVSWVFGVHGANFVKTMLKTGREQKELRVVDDRKGGPTEARDIADAILAMAEICLRPGFRDWGTYHFAGSPDTSWCGFARALFERAAERAPRIVPIAAAERVEPAPRPLNSTLDCTKIARIFGIARPDWRVSLSRVVAHLEGARA